MEDPGNGALGGAETNEFQWETSKENLQPVKVGRSAEALKQATNLVSSDKETAQKAALDFESQQNAFERDLASYDGEDKLGLWVRYLKWYQMALPAASKQTKTVELLERCTTDLFEYAEYKRDVRMLRLWIQYADLVKDPEDIFRFLQVHDIGQDYALFYEAYALCLEKRGSHKDAMAVYELGLSKMAMPLDRLRKKVTEFHKRMAKRAERDARRSAQTTPMHQDQAGARLPRQALNSIQRHRVPFVNPIFQTHQQIARVQTPQGQASGNARNEISVYADTPTELNATRHDAAGRNALSTIQGAQDPEAAADWKRLQTQEETSKENEQKAGKWSQYTISQAASAAPPLAGAGTPNPVSSLEVLVDEEFVDRTPFAREEGLGSGVRRRAAGLDRNASGVSATKTKGSTRKPKVKPSETVMGYAEAETKDGETGEEVSFEERRAAMVAMSGLSIQSAMASDGDRGEGSEGPAAGPPSPGQGEDVTLFTKEAFETIDAMFTSQKTIATKRQYQPDPCPSTGPKTQGGPHSSSNHSQRRLDFATPTPKEEGAAGAGAGADGAGEFDLEIYEDTTLLSASASGQGGIDILEDKENLGGAGPSSGCLGDQGPRAGPVLGLPLDQVSDQDLLLRGIEVGNGLPTSWDDDDDDDIFERDVSLLELPEDRLRAFVHAEEKDDDFQVYCDEE